MVTEVPSSDPRNHEPEGRLRAGTFCKMLHSASEIEGLRASKRAWGLGFHATGRGL